MALPGRNSEVLPFTLTEIFVLLVFLLLLLFFSTRALSETATQCAENARPGQQCIPVDPAEVPEPGETTISVPNSELPPPDSASDTTPEEGSEGKWRQVPDDFTQLVQCAGNPEEQSCGDVEGIIECVEAIGSGQECQPVGPDEIVVDSSFRAPINRVLGNPSIEPGDYPGLEFDLPNVEKGPCWRDPQDVLVSENVEEIYSFEVDMTPDSLTFTKVWPPRYDSVADTVPGLNELAKFGTVDIATYRREGQKILAWSDNQRPPCRLYTDIFYSLSAFESESDPIRASNEMETLVETFFYKRTNARPRNAAR